MGRYWYPKRPVELNRVLFFISSLVVRGVILLEIFVGIIEIVVRSGLWGSRVGTCFLVFVPRHVREQIPLPLLNRFE